MHARDACPCRGIEGRLEPAPDARRQPIQGGAVVALQRVARLVELRQRGVAPALDLGRRRLADRKGQVLRPGREAVVQLRGRRPDRTGSREGARACAGAGSQRNEPDEVVSTCPSAIAAASARQAPSPSRGSRSGPSPSATAGTRYWAGGPTAKNACSTSNQALRSAPCIGRTAASVTT